MIEDLVTNDACHFKALLACDGVDNHVAMDTNEVLRVKDAILVLVTVSRQRRSHANLRSSTFTRSCCVRAIALALALAAQHSAT